MENVAGHIMRIWIGTLVSHAQQLPSYFNVNWTDFIFLLLLLCHFVVAVVIFYLRLFGRNFSLFLLLAFRLALYKYRQISTSATRTSALSLLFACVFRRSRN